MEHRLRVPLRTEPNPGKPEWVANGAPATKSFPGLYTDPRAQPALPELPSIAVLQFQNMSGDTEQEYADGVAEEVIATLSRFSGLFVIARNSSFTYKSLSERKLNRGNLL